MVRVQSHDRRKVMVRMERRSRSRWKRSTEEIGSTIEKREEWEVRQDFTKNDAMLGRCFSDFDEEGHGCEFDFEAVTRIKQGEEQCWTASLEGDEGFQWREPEQEGRV